MSQAVHLVDLLEYQTSSQTWGCCKLYRVTNPLRVSKKGSEGLANISFVRDED